ncbi:MAG: serine/threonine-protein kinase [Desulfatibacillaceae bacterium]
MSGSYHKKSRIDASFMAGLSGVTHVSRYEIQRKLGQGAAGVVYLARDPYIKRKVAIKIARPENRAARERFFVEAQSAGSLNHPNIVSVHDVGEHNEFCYLTMEYVEGETLEEYCHKGNLMPLKQCIETVFSTCIALDYAHEQDVIHRDVKPSNIMLNRAGAAKIMDFGIAQMTGQTTEAGLWGTPGYMAPEQARNEPPTGRSDIFSLGSVLYELLAGEPAFAGDNEYSIIYKVTSEEPRPLSGIRPDLPSLLPGIVARAMAKDMDRRYQTCLEFAYELRMVLRTLTDEKTGTMDDVIDYVNGVSFFRNFARDQVSHLVRAGDILKAEKGRVILSEGEVDDTFYVLLGGTAAIAKGGKTIARVQAGEVFGEMAYIAGQARIASVVAETDCMLLRISATLLDRAPKGIQLLFFKNFATTLVQRLSKKTGPSDANVAGRIQGE